MKKNYRPVFLVCLILITLAGYVLVFGDVGLLLQDLRQKKLIRLQEEVSSLKKENAILQERFIQLQEEGQELPPRTNTSQGVTILKFSGTRKPDDSSSPTIQGASAISRFLSDEQGHSIVQARALYFSGMFLILLIGYLLPIWEKKTGPVQQDQSS